jgi:hypothetical protein
MPNAVQARCPCANSITRTQHYLILQFHGDHNLECHTRPIMRGRKSGPALGALKSYYSSGGDAEYVITFPGAMQKMWNPV